MREGACNYRVPEGHGVVVWSVVTGSLIVDRDACTSFRSSKLLSSSLERLLFSVTRFGGFLEDSGTLMASPLCIGLTWIPLRVLPCCGRLSWNSSRVNCTLLDEKHVIISGLLLPYMHLSLFRLVCLGKIVFSFFSRGTAPVEVNSTSDTMSKPTGWNTSPASVVLTPAPADDALGITLTLAIP